MTTNRVPLEIQVQQAIAFGHSLEWMIDNLGVDTRYVDDVLRRLDIINRSPDCEPARKPYRKCGAAA